MSKQKITDLPQAEQEKLIAEMKECGVKGVYTAYTVEKALEAIAKAKALKKGSEENPEEPAEEIPAEEPAEENPKEPAEEIPAEEIPADEPAEEIPAEETPVTPKEKVAICHICRSKVINGKCTGCDNKL